MSAVDISFIFQRVSEVAPGVPGVTDVICVSMSPQHFKGFLAAANASLQAYESGFGKLTIADQDIAPQKSAAEIEQLINEARQTNKQKP